MKQVDIILSQAIEEDLLEMLENFGLMDFYTKTDNIQGRGNTSPKMGSPIWPQLNVQYTFVVEDSKLSKFKEIVTCLRVQYPDDGVFATVRAVQVF